MVLGHNPNSIMTFLRIRVPSTQIRWYSPVRSRLPSAPRPRRSGKKFEGYSNSPPSSWSLEDSSSPRVYYDENAQSIARNRYVDPDPKFAGSSIQPSDAVYNILSHPTLAIERRVEFMNVILGFEQANRYAIMDISGAHIGYMEEEDFGIGKAIMRQVYRLHRPFSVRVFDRHGTHCLTIRRPFSFINSHIKAIVPSTSGNIDEDLVVGETKQQWHLWRRKYNLFLRQTSNEYHQFGRVDAPFLSFMFPVHDEHNRVIGAIDRNWVGFARELFTDTGVYMLRMDPSSFAELGHLYPVVAGPLTLDQRAVMLGTAVSIDFDYFSRHSRRGGGFYTFGDYD